MYSVARHVQKHARLLSVMESMDNGKSIRESRDCDIPLVARHLYHHAGKREREREMNWKLESFPCSLRTLSFTFSKGWAQLMDEEMKEWTSIGVVAAIVPWNFPLMLLSWKVSLIV